MNRPSELTQAYVMEIRTDRGEHSSESESKTYRAEDGTLDTSRPDRKVTWVHTSKLRH